MIHVFGLDPRLIGQWVQHGEHRLIEEAFGLGAPRAMLEVHKLHKWKRAALGYTEGFTELQRKQVDELIELFAEHRHLRLDAPPYDGARTWLENAEQEHARRDYRGILAPDNPRRHAAVVVSDRIDTRGERWRCPARLTAARTPAGIAEALGPMLANCRELHLVDPHFGPENARHKSILLALCDRLTEDATAHVHCGIAKEAPLAPSRVFFEDAAAQLAPRLPSNVVVKFKRWTARPGGDRLHNRYVMTPLGGVMLGVGLDAGKDGETDDLLLLSREQYHLRWKQYAMDDGTFRSVDTPAAVRGQRRR